MSANRCAKLEIENRRLTAQLDGKTPAFPSDDPAANALRLQRMLDNTRAQVMGLEGDLEQEREEAEVRTRRHTQEMAELLETVASLRRQSVSAEQMEAQEVDEAAEMSPEEWEEQQCVDRGSVFRPRRWCRLGNTSCTGCQGRQQAAQLLTLCARAVPPRYSNGVEPEAAEALDYDQARDLAEATFTPEPLADQAAGAEESTDEEEMEW